ncbi:hypothetical protein MBEHAL_0287 [Halarchaeum acidiphilum MH1-52-1]|uniref:HNH nuclease domain-containing protein n=2 Tax=Halarchaeum acidiphilum TaxID=489138 RepID=U2YS10_9EURY|nr:hypothetical protein MBEHAL_0287 [Halarchaeum acidiphilum MH1-52-1]
MKRYTTPTPDRIEREPTATQTTHTIMANATRHDDGESSTSDGERAPLHGWNETVDAATRKAVLARDGHRCQVCGRRGPKAGRLATLHVHHIERDPNEMAEHDLANLTTLCRPCHSWVHQQLSREESPVELTDADLNVLLPQDIEILRLLADEGPTRTGDIAGELTADLSVNAVRERLWVLMGLDNRVAERERQLVDKDVETGEWGLAGQIETSARGHIPSDPQVLLQRMEDEQVRRALDDGCDRRAIMAVLDVSRRSTFYKEKRANAYDFPLDAFSRGGRPTNEEIAERDSDDDQQLLDVATDDDLEPVETWGTSDATDSSDGGLSDPGSRERAGAPREEDDAADEPRRKLLAAIDALEAADEAL